MAVPSLTGCGDSDSSTAGEQSSTLRAAYHRPIGSLNPYGPLGGAQGTLLAATQVFDTLVVRRSGEIQPSIATDWETPDPNTWIFHLRDDVVFHDGSSLTADDVKASFDLVMGTESGFAELWEFVTTVEATDEHTVTVSTSEPLGTVLSNATLLYVMPVAAKDGDAFFDQPIGSGPFKVASFVASQSLTLSANADYWGDVPKVDSLELPYIEENSARLTAIRTGEVDVTWTVPPDQIQALDGESEIDIVMQPSLVYWFVWFNATREPFTDARVRQALWHAVDVEKVVADLFGETVKMSHAPIPSSTFGYEEQVPYAYDPAMTKQLLSDAGYPNGFTTELKWPRGQAPQIEQWASTLISYWAEVGVEVTPLQMEEAPYIEQTNNLDYDMITQTTDITNGDADYGLARLYACGAEQTGYCNNSLDSLLFEARSSPDQDRRQELYAEVCRIVWDEAVGIFPGEIVIANAVRNNVQGFTGDPLELIRFNSISVSD